MARFFLPMAYQPGSLELPEAVSHHAVRVQRLKVGDRLTLFNGEGQEAVATLTTAAKKAWVLIESIETLHRESMAHITLFQALPSMDKMDMIIQKSVELGVACIQPVITQRGLRLEKERQSKKALHWQNIVVSASEQSGRTALASVLPLRTLDQALLNAQSADHRLLLNPLGKQSLTRDIMGQREPFAQKIALWVGPEGGWTSTEIESLEKAGFISVHLGPRILRVETAAMMAIGLCQAKFGDF